jgi:hypothetical protein
MENNGAEIVELTYYCTIKVNIHFLPLEALSQLVKGLVGVGVGFNSTLISEGKKLVI